MYILHYQINYAGDGIGPVNSASPVIQYFYPVDRGERKRVQIDKADWPFIRSVDSKRINREPYPIDKHRGIASGYPPGQSFRQIRIALASTSDQTRPFGN